MSGTEPQTKSRLLSLSPQYLTLDLDQAIEFYTAKLGFRVKFRYDDFYASVERDGITIHLKLSDEPDPGRAFKSLNEHLDVYILTDEIDRLCAELLGNGVELVQSLYATPWNTREFVVKDRDGYILYFGQPNGAAAP